MKIFVIHYKKLVDRKKHIIQQFAKFNIKNYEFIDIDRDEIENYDTSMFEPNYSRSQIAIALSHFYAYKQIAEKYKIALILEDDVIFSNNFIRIFNNALKQLPKNFEMLFIGNGCNLHIPNNELVTNKLVYKVNTENKTRCLDSYIVTNKSAQKICNYIQQLPYKINIPVDHWMNRAINDTKTNVYWLEPTIVIQGTQNGTYYTSHDQ